MRYTKLIELIPSDTFGYDSKYKSFDDTLIEKLNYRYTVVLLLALSYLVTSKQINGARKNIQCFVPAHLHLNNTVYTDYINEYCYLSLTYYTPYNEKIVRSSDSIQYNNEIKYYQLTHYFLILISILIYLPRMIYQLLTLIICDLDLKSLTDAILQLKLTNGETTNKSALVRYIVHYIDIYLSKSLMTRRRQKTFEKCFRNRVHANSNLFQIFCFMKFFYIFNYVISIYFLNYLLGNDYYLFFGFKYLRNLSISSFDLSTFFPKVIFYFFFFSC